MDFVFFSTTLYYKARFRFQFNPPPTLHKHIRPYITHIYVQDNILLYSNAPPRNTVMTLILKFCFFTKSMYMWMWKENLLYIFFTAWKHVLPYIYYIYAYGMRVGGVNSKNLTIDGWNENKNGIEWRTPHELRFV